MRVFYLVLSAILLAIAVYHYRHGYVMWLVIYETGKNENQS